MGIKQKIRDVILEDLGNRFSHIGKFVRDIINEEVFNKGKIKSYIKEIAREEIELIKWREFFYDKKVGYIIEYDGLEYECFDEVGLLGGTRELALKVGDQEKVIIIDWGTPLDMKFVKA